MIQYEMIHHTAVNVTDLEKSKAFYRDVLGLKEIERPPFDFPGAWFAIGESGQQLHLIVHSGETLRRGGIDTRDGHFALRVRNFEATREWLDRCGVEYVISRNSIAGFPQIFVLDPDRNVIELNAQSL